MALSREFIVAKALSMLREGGLDALSLRKLATELDVAAPTLYWHVKSKRELLDLVADELLRESETMLVSEPAPRQPWWEWLRVRAESIFDTLVDTRDAPRVLAGNRPSLDSLEHLDRTLKSLMDVGMSAADAQQALFSIGAYVIGCVTEWQGEAERAGVEVSGDAERGVELPQYPHIHAAFSALADQPHRATFEFGLRCLIDGLRARYDPGSLPR